MPLIPSMKSKNPLWATVIKIYARKLRSWPNKLENPTEEAALVVDTGYSFSHVVPFVAGRAIHSGAYRGLFGL